METPEPQLDLESQFTLAMIRSNATKLSKPELEACLIDMARLCLMQKQWLKDNIIQISLPDWIAD